MPSLPSGALLGVVLSVVLGAAGRWRRPAPSRMDAPVSWGRSWIRLGLAAGLGALLGTTLLVSGYWAYVGPPSSISETGPELALQTLGTLANPAFFGFVGGFVVLLWAPTRLYARMSEAAVRIHVTGTLVVGLGLIAVFCGFVGVPPIPRNAQAGIGLFLYSIAGLLLYLLVVGATALAHLSSGAEEPNESS
ncbi:MAG: hypothetical protein ABEL51_12630 [Salinibacter sp.]